MLVFRHLHPPLRSVFLLMAVDNEDIHRRRTRELFPVQSTALLLPSKIPPTAPSCLVHKANQKGIIRPLFTRSSSTILVSSALIHRVSLKEGRTLRKLYKPFVRLLIIFPRLIIIFNASLRILSLKDIHRQNRRFV